MKPAQPPLIGSNIQAIRKRQKLTLDMLSEKSGVSKAMLSQIESEKVNPTVATVWKIAQGLEVDINTLLKGGHEPARKFTVTRRDKETQPPRAHRIETGGLGHDKNADLAELWCIGGGKALEIVVVLGRQFNGLVVLADLHPLEESGLAVGPLLRYW